MKYNIHYGPGPSVRRMVVQGPHAGDVVIARPGPDHDTIRLMERWNPRRETFQSMAREDLLFASPRVMVYYRVTFYIGSVLLDAYVLPGFMAAQLGHIPHLARLQLHAEILLTA